MVAVENALVAAVTVFALTLTAFSVLAWRRSRDSHFLILGGAFGVFFAKGLFLTAALFASWGDLPQLFILSSLFDLLILALFYGFTLRR